MKKMIVSLLIVIGIIFVGWILKDVTIQDINAADNRFVMVHKETSSGSQCKVYYDNKTKVMYLVVDVYHGGGIAVLVDKDGKPLLYKGE